MVLTGQFMTLLIVLLLFLSLPPTTMLFVFLAVTVWSVSLVRSQLHSLFYLLFLIVSSAAVVCLADHRNFMISVYRNHYTFLLLHRTPLSTISIGSLIIFHDISWSVSNAPLCVLTQGWHPESIPNTLLHLEDHGFLNTAAFKFHPHHPLTDPHSVTIPPSLACLPVVTCNCLLDFTHIESEFTPWVSTQREQILSSA